MWASYALRMSWIRMVSASNAVASVLVIGCGASASVEEFERSAEALVDVSGFCGGKCGGRGSTGCWCDSACARLGDCCHDKERVCSSDAGASDVGTPEAGASVTKTFHRDLDSDGYGDPAKTIAAVSAPSGYVSNASDCDDEDANAFPGQTQFFSSATKKKSFDYDCSGSTTTRYNTRGYLYRTFVGGGVTCQFKEGYATTPPSTCGGGAWYLKGYIAGPTDCYGDKEWRFQECR